jgi:putative peptidoglycan lipid II flippase
VPAGYGGYGPGPGPNNPSTWALPDRGPSGTAPYQPPSATAGYGGAQYTGTQYAAPGRGPLRDGGNSRIVLAVVIVLVLAAVGVAVWAVGFRKPGTPTAGSSTQPPTSTSASAAGAVLTPVSDSTFNIYGTPPGNTENQSTAPFAIDGSTSTAWSTSFYFDHPNFGGLKPGTGLLLDMGQEVRLSQVEVLFGAQGATTAEVYLGNSAAMSRSALASFTLVSPSASVTGDHKFPVSGQATGRYVLIWLTSLPQLAKAPVGLPPGHTFFQGLIYNVVVRGSAVSGSS